MVEQSSADPPADHPGLDERLHREFAANTARVIEQITQSLSGSDSGKLPDLWSEVSRLANAQALRSADVLVTAEEPNDVLDPQRLGDLTRAHINETTRAELRRFLDSVPSGKDLTAVGDQVDRPAASTTLPDGLSRQLAAAARGHSSTSGARSSAASPPPLPQRDSGPDVDEAVPVTDSCEGL
ncbi:hypothetical protein [Nocardia suismassiliense]|uniref:hypothetical protein n=1 Tax=Nocardia suismassiliense TaxID=2077092 RepID=UPI000D1E15F2|nr:hypothetical protein [Nocardia suismassiliense]